MRLFLVLVVSLVTFGSPAVAGIASAAISGTIEIETGVIFFLRCVCAYGG